MIATMPRSRIEPTTFELRPKLLTEIFTHGKNLFENS